MLLYVYVLEFLAPGLGGARWGLYVPSLKNHPTSCHTYTLNTDGIDYHTYTLQ